MENDPPMLLPSYSCHKVVKAAKITGADAFPEGGAVLYLDLHAPDGSQVETKVTAEWLVKHAPDGVPAYTPGTLVGGYFVAYPDGYTSWSPAKAFEEGYSLNQDEAPEPEAAPGTFTGAGSPADSIVP